MKFIHLCILGLVCLTAVRATEPSVSAPKGSVAKSVEATHSEETQNKLLDKDGNEYVKQTGDVTYEWSEHAEKDVEVDDEPITKIVDGKIVTTYNKKSTKKVDYKIKFKRVKREWTQNIEIPSVANLLLTIREHIPVLREDDYTLFNNIASTDQSNLQFDYNYWEINHDDLAAALPKLVAVYKSKVLEEDIEGAIQQIKACEEGFLFDEIPSDDVNVNNEDGWNIHLQFVIISCKKEATKSQVFAWSGKKSGTYHPGQYSDENAKTVHDVINTWLYSNIPLLATCTSSPKRKMHIWGGSEASLNEPYSSSASEASVDGATWPHSEDSAPESSCREPSIEEYISTPISEETEPVIVDESTESYHHLDATWPHSEKSASADNKSESTVAEP